MGTFHRLKRCVVLQKVTAECGRQWISEHKNSAGLLSSATGLCCFWSQEAWGSWAL